LPLSFLATYRLKSLPNICKGLCPSVYISLMIETAVIKFKFLMFIFELKLTKYSISD